MPKIFTENDTFLGKYKGIWSKFPKKHPEKCHRFSLKPSKFTFSKKVSGGNIRGFGLVPPKTLKKPSKNTLFSHFFENPKKPQFFSIPVYREKKYPKNDEK
jgi:hypothetical protein